MTDFLLVAWVSALIELRRFGWMFGLGKRWTPGEKLKLLFAGYNGTRNTGSDVRVQEMLRQIRHVLGAENVDFSVMTQNFDRTKGYFEGTRQVHLPDVYPPFLFREVHGNHGVISCEGSMFKSKFANALTTMMIGSLGLASAENKLSVAYGGDAGHMDDLIEWMCARYTKESLVITRSMESQRLLSGMGVHNELGADTAWTFDPHPQQYARQVLRQAGWDEQTPILVLCPIHPFVWPVRASIGKYIARSTTGAYHDSQYRTVYFFESGANVDRKFQHYINGYKNAVKAFVQKHRVFPILVAMERLDAVACREITKEMPGIPIFTSDDHLHARGRGFRGGYHGRTHPQLDARARASAPFAHRGGSRPRTTAFASDGIAGQRSRRDSRKYRQDRGQQSERHVAHVRFSGRRNAPGVSRIPTAQGCLELGR